MILIYQLLSKKLERFHENISNNKNDFWNFYQMFNFINALAGTVDERSNVKNRLWMNHLNNFRDRKNLLLFKRFLDYDSTIVNSFISSMKRRVDKEVKPVPIYVKGCVGVLSYEYPK